MHKEIKIGETNFNNQGLKMEIIEDLGYIKQSRRVVVRFEDGFEKECSYGAFKSGKVKNKNVRGVSFKDRTGEEGINKQGFKMKIVECQGNSNIVVEFEDGNRVNTSYQSFKNKTVRNKKYRLGEKSITKKEYGEYEITIVEYNFYNDILVEFNDISKTRVKTTYGSFISGGVINPNRHLGEEATNKQGCLMKIISCKGEKIGIEFQDEYMYKIYNRSYRSFEKGSIKNPYGISICGVACLGNTSTIDKNGLTKQSYICYRNAMRRCGSESFKEKHPSYTGVEVQGKMKCYEFFEKFYNETLIKEQNFPADVTLCLDKDILCKGNKVYSFETVMLVPLELNSVFVKNNVNRGNLPIGVRKIGNRYYSGISKYNKDIQLGSFDTPEEAFYAYKIAKEEYIKQIADDYVEKGYITKDSRLYKALYRYEIEIND